MNKKSILFLLAVFLFLYSCTSKHSTFEEIVVHVESREPLYTYAPKWVFKGTIVDGSMRPIEEVYLDLSKVKEWGIFETSTRFIVQGVYLENFFEGVEIKGYTSLEFDDAFQRILLTEGGYVFDLLDRGGETKYGITIGTARSFGYTGPMSNLSLELAKIIYYERYWNILQLGSITGVNESLAYRLFDLGVHAGTETSAKFLQRALNALRRADSSNPLFSPLTVDGEIGSATLTALDILNSRGDINKVILLVTSLQGAHYLNLTEKYEGDQRFIRGWLRRIESNDLFILVE